jgi:AcrR family transcriptional regulator
MGRRQEAVEATRTRIAAAAFELHATVGPAQTSISAVAEKAGVQRHTVYHHYPDLGALFRACTEHGMQVTRTPEADSWRAIHDPAARLRHGLGDLYAYYRANARLLGNFARDMQLMSEVGGAEAFVDRMEQLFEALTQGWPGDSASNRLQMAAIGHAMAYETWRSLTNNGLSDDQARDMMVGFVTGIVAAGGARAT